MREKVAIILGVMLCFILLGIWFYMRDETMLYGETIIRIEKEIKLVKEENIRLKEEILKKSSLNFIQAESEKRGFKRYESIYIIPDTYTLE